MDETALLITSIVYICLLFAIAYWGDKRADAGRSVIANPWIYTLSLAVYCTAWTFYGSVGRASTTGVGFLPIYLGPTLAAVLFWLVLRRIVRLVKAQRITSIADFLGSRYGKTGLLAGLATTAAVVGIMPYIAIQLKAIAASYAVIYAHYSGYQTSGLESLAGLYTALLLILFAILFGTRHLDSTERHEGLVAAVAFESLVKLLAFMLVGAYVTFGLFGGIGDIFARAQAHPELAALMTFDVVPGGYSGWLTLTLLSMLAFWFLPRQFQMLAVENVDEKHLRMATWLFPLYLLLINLFVLPIAIGGKLWLGDEIDADLLVLALPLSEGQAALAALAFLGGLSAATSMVIVETVALSTMVSNDLVMPLLLRWQPLGLRRRHDLTGLILAVRRLGIALIILLGYGFFYFVGDSHALVSMGILSFAAAAQLAPPAIAGLYWRSASRQGALWGLSIGFSLWAYTLLLPAIVESGWLPAALLADGPGGLEWLKPQQLFGLTGLDPYTHGAFWSLTGNVLGLVLGSLWGRRDAMEWLQADAFVSVMSKGRPTLSHWTSHKVPIGELRSLVVRFVGQQRADSAFEEHALGRGYGEVSRADLDSQMADADWVEFSERLLAGTIGAASARVMISSIVKGSQLGIDQVLAILDETSQVIEYSHRLELKSRQLEQATAELRAANERLQELDRLKDEFVSTVTHELRTPLTSIRAFSEILYQNDDIDPQKRQDFLRIIVKENERLTRLINQVLTLSKLESGSVEWHPQRVSLRQIIDDAVESTGQLFFDKEITLEVCDELDEDLKASAAEVEGDPDQLLQVLINLLSNAAKFSPAKRGVVRVRLRRVASWYEVAVCDNGPGIKPQEQAAIFDKFHQVQDTQQGKPPGTGLGLAICRHIIDLNHGKIGVRSEPNAGASFWFRLPIPLLEEGGAGA